MKQKFDYQQYWEERLRTTGENLKGVGHKSFGELANRLMYKKTQIQLEKVLKDNKIFLKNKTVFDAGAGIGLFTKFYLDKGAKVFAADISDEALKILKRKYPEVEVKRCSLADIKINRKFNIVHCFDVLYHITNQKDWERSVENLGKLSSEYILIHNINTYWFKSLNFLFERKHIKMEDRNIRIEEKLKKLRFKKIGYYPTHILYVRPMIHLITKFFPYVTYSIDNFLLLVLKLKGLESTGITIYKKV